MSRFRRWMFVPLCLGVAACQGLLTATDPTRISDADIANANGANARRLFVSAQFSSAVVAPAMDVARFTDEWTLDFPTNYRTNDRTVILDQRNGDGYQASNPSDGHLGPLDGSFAQAGIAITAVRAETPDSLRGDFLAQLYAIRGYSVLQMAEDLCPGFPVNDVVDNLAVWGGPLTTDSAVGFASAQLDSAIKYVHDSTRFETLARVAKGRALLDRGQFAEAAAVVANVPTASAYLSETGRIQMSKTFCSTCLAVAVGEREGGNGLPFVSAHDPRIPTVKLGVRRTNTLDTLYYTTLGQATTDRIVIASGIEARLIEAEAALHANDPSWKTILDDLRAAVGLDPVVDPGTADARVDLLYSERAFWLYLTGRRLGDLRRLIWVYHRAPETVFPSGAYHGGNGGQYGSATSIPFVEAEQERYNPNMTSGCQAGP